MSHRVWFQVIIGSGFGEAYGTVTSTWHVCLWTACIMFMSSLSHSGHWIFPQLNMCGISSDVNSEPSAGPVTITVTVTQQWTGLVPERIQQLFDSLPHHIAVYIQAQGPGATPYWHGISAHIGNSAVHLIWHRLILIRHCNTVTWLLPCAY